MTAETANAVALLEAAAARLRDTGWTRGEYGPQGGPNCVLGAVIREAEGHGYPNFARNLALHALFRQVGDNSPPAWNDHVCPDAATAADALLNAAKALAGEGKGA